MMGKSNYQKGIQGQQIAENFLQAQGHEILHRNYHTAYGEIDLITMHNGYVVFVEVKARGTTNYGYPREAVGRKKQMHIIKSAMVFIADFDMGDADFRFDVVELQKYDSDVEIEHIENAFDVSGYG